MTKQKQSFFERLTGARAVDETPSQVPIFEESTEEFVETYGAPEASHMGHVSIPEEPRWVGNASENQNDTIAQDDAEGQLTIDVYQTDDAIVIKSTIAGVKPEDLDVAINNDMVTIKGERKNEESVPDGNYYYQECYWGPFSRSILLPVDIISDKAEASLKNGILTIRLPKADTTRIKRIQVRGF
jgi:HSP20 family protein